MSFIKSFSMRGDFEFLTSQDEKNYNEIRELLEKHGIHINIDPDKNWLHINVLENKLTRCAGRREKISTLPANEEDLSADGYRLVCYSNILKWQETMSVDEIVSKLNMSKRTYYRRIKKMNQVIEEAKNTGKDVSSRRF